MDDTMPSTSGVTNRTFRLRIQKLGLGCLMDNTVTKPSRTSSPVMAGSFSLRKLLFLAKALTARVSAVRYPTECVPPSGFGMALVK